MSYYRKKKLLQLRKDERKLIIFCHFVNKIKLLQQKNQTKSYGIGRVERGALFNQFLSLNYTGPEGEREGEDFDRVGTYTSSETKIEVKFIGRMYIWDEKGRYLQQE